MYIKLSVLNDLFKCICNIMSKVCWLGTACTGMSYQIIFRGSKISEWDKGEKYHSHEQNNLLIHTSDSTLYHRSSYSVCELREPGNLIWSQFNLKWTSVPSKTFNKQRRDSINKVQWRTILNFNIHQIKIEII